MNKTKQITFSQLDQVLKELGFCKKVVPDTGVAYKHSPSGLVLAVRLHKPNEVVPDYVMVATRGQLDRHGVIETKDFEEMLKATAV